MGPVIGEPRMPGGRYGKGTEVQGRLEHRQLAMPLVQESLRHSRDQIGLGNQFDRQQMALDGSDAARVLRVLCLRRLGSVAGLSQLATGVRRWRSYGAQWAMILSGAQSALAGTHFAQLASGPETPDITAIAPYAAFGAFYFFVSAVWLLVATRRRSVAQLPGETG